MILWFKILQTFKPFFINLLNSKNRTFWLKCKFFQITENPKEWKSYFIELSFIDFTLISVIWTHFTIQIDNLLYQTDLRKISLNFLNQILLSLKSFLYFIISNLEYLIWLFNDNLCEGWYVFEILLHFWVLFVY